MKRGIKALIIIAIVIVVIVGVSFSVSYMMARINKVQIDPDLAVYLGGGGNSVVLTYDDGKKALVIDTKYFGAAEKLKSEIKVNNITVINTHNHMDHTQGNKLYNEANFITSKVTREQWTAISGQIKYPDRQVAENEEIILDTGNEKVHIINTGRAHSSDDCIVYFENKKLIATGDLVFIKWHPPYMDPACNISSWIKTLDKLINDYNISTVVPGHGDISTKESLLTMKDYFTSITEAIGNATQLDSLKEKYRNYTSIPLMSGFNKTVLFIQNEKKTR